MRDPRKLARDPRNEHFHKTRYREKIEQCIFLMKQYRAWEPEHASFETKKTRFIDKYPSFVASELKLASTRIHKQILDIQITIRI